jgi:hypothetical protein
MLVWIGCFGVARGNGLEKQSCVTTLTESDVIRLAEKELIKNGMGKEGRTITVAVVDCHWTARVSPVPPKLGVFYILVFDMSGKYLHTVPGR